MTQIQITDKNEQKKWLKEHWNGLTGKQLAEGLRKYFAKPKKKVDAVTQETVNWETSEAWQNQKKKQI